MITFPFIPTQIYDLARVPVLLIRILSGSRRYSIVTPRASITANYGLMIVTGLRIQASWVMFSIDCRSIIPMEFQVNIA